MKAITPKSYTRMTSVEKNKINEFINAEIRQGVKKATSTAIDCATMLSALVLINEFGFGTIGQKGKQSRLMRFLEAYQQMANEYGNTYDEAALEAMRHHLKNSGLDFETR